MQPSHANECNSPFPVSVVELADVWLVCNVLQIVTEVLQFAVRWATCVSVLERTNLYTLQIQIRALWTVTVELSAAKIQQQNITLQQIKCRNSLKYNFCFTVFVDVPATAAAFLGTTVYQVSQRWTVSKHRCVKTESRQISVYNLYTVSTWEYIWRHYFQTLEMTTKRVSVRLRLWNIVTL